ncbi:ParM/StbA family protein [Clostridium estertheticum]|uniref:ParM/StbA family protein n=1 Tax=Clostridium estertheticum TaxID=238834 RepID=UPI00124CB210|nr:ParM/StbA family protein [Clostridium estertheticum]MBZ9618439.1 ParM/StbA family protein [Clostridium estertheticum subsp. laramiense]WAG76324.1 ParM/StbA family protein [Clostridium estertheticum]
MNIRRFNGDFGNSTNNFMIDGYYLEIPTNVVEISETKANELFVNPITQSNELLERLVISTEIDGKERYYLVGEMAEMSKLSNGHVAIMHDKIKSNIPYLSFLSAVSYYDALNSDNNDNKIEIDYMSTMLPIWLLKREDKFSYAQKQMEERFIGEHSVKIITLGMEKELKIVVKRTKCRIESEVARHALKYKMLASEEDKNVLIIEKRNNVEFANFQVVLVDIGGGSTDAVKLAKGLSTPQSRASFQVIDIAPFLGEIEQLRKEKLLEYFHNLRALEKFIVENYKQKKYIFKDENTGENYDFTSKINEVLQEYSNIFATKLLNSFINESGEPIKFIYFGGEASILEPFIKQSLLEHMSEAVVENNHFFLNEILEDDTKEIFKPSPRTINLAALEILSINEMRKTNEGE